MSTTTFAVRASLLASIILSGQAMAQGLPDEINHPQYQRVYQNLEQVLQQKITEHNKLSDQKEQLEKLISQMEKDKVEIPERNRELEKLIESKRQEIVRLSAEIQGVESVLGRVLEDLARIDNMISRLTRDLQTESTRSQSIQQQRNQVAHDVAQINNRLQRELREENQSILVLNRLTNEVNAAEQKRQEISRERAQLVRDVERFRREIVVSRNAINQNNSALTTKRAQLSTQEARLPGVKAELSTEESKLSQMDSNLNPKKAKLDSLRSELARLSPDIARLQNENRALNDKISTNEGKIKAANLQEQISRRDSLNNEIAPAKEEIKTRNASIVTIQENIRPVTIQINELNVKVREAQVRRNMPEVARLKAQIVVLKNSISSQEQELTRLQKEVQTLSESIAAKAREISNLDTSIARLSASNSALQNEINAAKVKIAQNDQKIKDQSAANAGLSQEIATLNNEVTALQNQRNPLANRVADLKNSEDLISKQVATLKSEIKNLQTETARLTTSVAEMDKTITEFPQTVRRLDAHVTQLNARIQQSNSEIDREQRLLSRIRQDRMTVEGEMNRAQHVLSQINNDLAVSENLIAILRTKLNEENRTRDGLTRYNQESIKKLDSLKQQQSEEESDIASALEEIKINDQDIQTIASELPRKHAELGVLAPKVSSALSAKNSAQKNADDAKTQYESRLALYQTHLTSAADLGAQKAVIGSQDGTKAGAAEAKAKASKLAAENASAEAKWEALRRGYVRGEIEGFSTGFAKGLASSEDAQRGESDGRVAGARRAKDHANMVLKPEIYLDELNNRLTRDATVVQQPKMAALITQEVSMIKAMAISLEASIPELSQSELSEATRIVTSLDTLIAQSEIEISEVLKLRQKLSEARNVYSAPGAGENANTINCTAVYKSVKEFVDACKGSYTMRYQNLYKTSHETSFKREYSQAFNTQIESVFSAELTRLYPVYLKEASAIGGAVGVSAGKKEVYEQSFNRSEVASYSGSLGAETARVESEAIKLVEEHLDQNAALALKGEPRLSTESAYGLSPGVEADLKMIVKNIGSVASQENSLVKITEISGALSAERKDAPLTSVAPHSHTDLSVLKVKVTDGAIPGMKVVLAGEIVHPGNHYRSNRIETFRIESVLGVNPSISSEVKYDKTPTVRVPVFGTLRKHDIDLSFSPKYTGVDEGYEFDLEEVGSDLIEITSRPKPTGALKRNEAKKVNFTYRISKSGRGKTIKMKLTIKNGGKVVSSEDLEVKAQ